MDSTIAELQNVRYVLHWLMVMELGVLNVFFEFTPELP